MKYDAYVGIDPGTTTGVAIWDAKEKKFTNIFSGGILQVMTKLEVYTVFGNNLFVIENPNLRKWFGNTGRERLQGSGSIKRDFAIWKEWFEKHDCEYREIAPKNVRTKLKSPQFESTTGYQGATNNHGRDAAMMVWGIRGSEHRFKKVK